MSNWHEFTSAYGEGKILIDLRLVGAIVDNSYEDKKIASLHLDAVAASFPVVGDYHDIFAMVRWAQTPEPMVAEPNPWGPSQLAELIARYVHTPNGGTMEIDSIGELGFAASFVEELDSLGITMKSDRSTSDP